MQSIPIKFNQNSRMPFGKHKGKAMFDVPAKYLMWLYETGCMHTGVKHYINENYQALWKEVYE